MSNVQARLIASAIALLAGGVIASTSRISVDVGIAIMVVAGALFVVEYWRCHQ